MIPMISRFLMKKKAAAITLTWPLGDDFFSQENQHISKMSMAPIRRNTWQGPDLMIFTRAACQLQVMYGGLSTSICMVLPSRGPSTVPWPAQKSPSVPLHTELRLGHRESTL